MTTEITNQTIEIQTATAEGPVLDWLVTKCEYPHNTDSVWRNFGGDCEYSTDPAQAWPIIDREGISTECHWPTNPEKKTWNARIGLGRASIGSTALIAAMRYYAWSKLGETARVPLILIDETHDLGNFAKNMIDLTSQPIPF